MSEMRVIATVDVDKEKAPNDLGVRKLAYTENPAIIYMGVAFEAEKPVVPLSTDGKKMRICAPVLVPGEIFRKSLGGHTVVFTANEIELMALDFMQRYNSQESYFKHEHTDKTGVGSYILETWIIENAETDKANTVYNLDLPVGSWVIITQFTDEAEFKKVVDSGATGISIEGWLGHKMELSEEQDYADVILIKDGKALFLKRNENDDFEAGKLGFAGGKIEPNEDPKQAAIRELAEETGIIVDDVKEIEVIENEDGTKSHYFVAKTTENPILSDEHSAFEWLNADEIGENVIKSQTERFKNLTNKAQNMAEDSTKIGLPDGEYTDKDGNTFKVVNGAIVAPEKMEDQPKDGEEKPADEKTDGEKTEMEEQPAPAPKEGEMQPTADYFTKDEVNEMISSLKEEFAKVVADMKTELQGTGKSDDGGEEVEMSAEARTFNRLEALREQLV